MSKARPAHMRDALSHWQAFCFSHNPPIYFSAAAAAPIGQAKMARVAFLLCSVMALAAFAPARAQSCQVSSLVAVGTSTCQRTACPGTGALAPHTRATGRRLDGPVLCRVRCTLPGNGPLQRTRQHR